MTYTISWNHDPEGQSDVGGGSKVFDDDVPFHSAVAEVLAECGPVGLDRLVDELRVAAAAGSYIDPLAVIRVMATAMGVFGDNGSARRPLTQVRGIRHQLEPMRN